MEVLRGQQSKLIHAGFNLELHEYDWEGPYFFKMNLPDPPELLPASGRENYYEKLKIISLIDKNKNLN